MATSRVRTPRNSALHAALGALALCLAAGGSPPLAASPALQATGPVTYRLVDTWKDQPWQLTAGRYGLVRDISSAADGTVFVLDVQNAAIHVLGPEAAAQAAFHIPGAFAEDAAWHPRRIDVGPDGRVYVLSAGQLRENDRYTTRIDRMSPAGELEHSFEVYSEYADGYDDIAVRPDGRIYLSRIGPGNPFFQWPGPTPTPVPDGPPTRAVEVYARSGAHLASLSPPELGVPGSLDFAADGTLYVVNRVPTPWLEPPEGPTPTPRPSLDRPVQALQQPVQPIEGVLVFAPDHQVVETVPFTNAEDVAVGDPGVFVSRNVEIFALRQAEPLWTGPTARIYAAYYGRIALSLDVHADGRLMAGLNHCYFQGVLAFERPTEPPLDPRYAGENDAPFLEGPPYPLRLGADEQLAALQGRYYGVGIPPDRAYAASNFLVDPQTVQRWTRYGQPPGASRLRSQLGLCAGLDAWYARDVAVDGTDVYTVDPSLVQRRPTDGLPAWTVWPGALLDPDRSSSLKAVDARDGTVVVLDAGAARVHVLYRDGTLGLSWPLDAGDENALPADIALGDGRVYLADLGRSRVSIHALDGARLGEFPTHDGPASLDVAPDGSVFVLGRGGWGFRYDPTGTLEAMWPMPDRSLDALDLAVDTDGRVYVGFARTESLGPPTAGRAIVLFDILDAGIWVFEPVPAPPLPDLDPDACAVRLDKRADPTRLRLGAQTQVRLQVDGRCPGAYDPVQLVVVLDSSRSMTFDRAVERARDAVGALLARLDPRAAQVALVTFEEGASLVLPLTRDLAEVSASIGAQDAWGDTRLAAGLALAHQELSSPRGDPSARRIVLVVSDGVFNDDPLAVAEAIRDDGIEIVALILPTYEFHPDHRAVLDQMTADPGSVIVDPDPATLIALGDDMIRYRRQDGLFATLTIDDIVPANMRYVVGSAVPPALWDETARTLSWTFENVSVDRPVEARYRLEPLEPGTWPTNVIATASYVDALGTAGRLPFPVPRVVVETGVYHAYLPLAARDSCFRGPKPIDLVLLVDTSSSMSEPAGPGAPTAGTKLDAARAAASTLLGLLRWPGDNPDRAAVVSFDRVARSHTPLTADRLDLAQALAGLQTAPNTHIDLGLAEAARVLAGRRWNATGVLVVLTDGLNNDGPDPVLAAADALRRDQILVYAVGLGPLVDEALLRALATAADGYYASPTAADLERVYRQIASRLACDLP